MPTQLRRDRHPRTLLGSETGRLRDVLLDLEHVLAADTDESLFWRVEAYADDLLLQLSHTMKRIEEARASVADVLAEDEPELPVIERRAAA